MQCLDLKRDDNSEFKFHFPHFKMEIINLCHWVLMGQTQGDVYRGHRTDFLLFLLFGGRGVYDNGFF